MGIKSEIHSVIDGLFLWSMVVCDFSAALIVDGLTVHTDVWIKESRSSTEGETRSWKIAQP